MKFITVREFRSNTAKMWRQLQKEHQLIVTRRGKPVAMLTSTNEKDIGDAILRDQGRKALAALDQLQISAKANGLSTMSMSQIDKTIADSRKTRSPKRR